MRATIVGVDDLVAVAIRLVSAHPAVTGAEFAGSRSRGEHHELSDWDVAVQTSDFAAVARDMHALVAPLEPIGEQWEPVGHFPVYQVMLRGPTKLEYLFLDESQDAMPALAPGPDTLAAINTHFWDWIWWLITKDAAGRGDLVAEHMPQMHAHLLRPLGDRGGAGRHRRGDRRLRRAARRPRARVRRLGAARARGRDPRLQRAVVEVDDAVVVASMRLERELAGRVRR